MKLSEIEVGKEYAVGSKNFPYRYKVLEVGKFKKKVWDSGAWYPHDAIVSGAKVIQIYGETEGKTPEIVVAQKIIKPWEEYEEDLNKEKQSIDEKKQIKYDLESEVKQLGISGSVRIRNSSWAPYDPIGIEIFMSFGEARNFIEERKNAK